jgi:hypothetical protein
MEPINYKISTDPLFLNGTFNFLEDSNSNLIFLPENLNEIQDSSKFIYPETTTDIRKIFKKENIIIDYLTSDKPILRSRKSADWFGPTIFIGFSILSQNSNLINISLNLLSSYLYDFFNQSISKKKVKFHVVIENKKNKEFRTISYEGPVDGIKELAGVIKEFRNDNTV